MPGPLLGIGVTGMKSADFLLPGALSLIGEKRYTNILLLTSCKTFGKQFNLMEFL